MDNGNEDPDYDAVQELIHDARIERALAVGDAIGQACARMWSAISVATSRHRVASER